MHYVPNDYHFNMEFIPKLLMRYFTIFIFALNFQNWCALFTYSTSQFKLDTLQVLNSQCGYRYHIGRHRSEWLLVWNNNSLWPLIFDTLYLNLVARTADNVPPNISQNIICVLIWSKNKSHTMKIWWHLCERIIIYVYPYLLGITGMVKKRGVKRENMFLKPDSTNNYQNVTLMSSLIHCYIKALWSM
jgi:hypothetical protein